MTCIYSYTAGPDLAPGGRLPPASWRSFCGCGKLILFYSGVFFGLRESHFFVFVILWKWRDGSLLILVPVYDRYHVILSIPIPKNILSQQGRYMPNVPILIDSFVFVVGIDINNRV